MSTHLTFSDTITTFNVTPCELSLVPRAHLTRAYDGTPQKASFANETYGYQAIVIQFYWSSLTSANYVKILEWSSAGTSITVTDSDTNTEYSVYTGLIEPPTNPNSQQKNPKRRPSIRVLLTSVTQR